MESDKHPAEVLVERAIGAGMPLMSRQFAALLDDTDPLRDLRQQFHDPLNKDMPGVDLTVSDGSDPCVYFAWHSLGLQPRNTRLALEKQMDNWANMASQIWNLPYGESAGSCDIMCVADMATLVGARPHEVAVMNGLTVNIHMMLVSFYQPTPTRHKILLETHAFPSDHFCIESHIHHRGYDPATSMIQMKPKKGEYTLRTEDILAVLEAEGESIAVVWLPGQHYYTGQAFDMPVITKAAHKQGCYVGFDLAHAVGSLSLEMHDWQVDFACWCTNKYLCGGPGGVGGIFVHEKHENHKFPRLVGWMGRNLEKGLKIESMTQLTGAAGYRITTPPLLAVACLRAALQLFTQTPRDVVRHKSMMLVAYMELLIQRHLPNVTIITPADPAQRGGQLSLVVSGDVCRLVCELNRRGVKVDQREEHMMRVSSMALYNSFEDVLKFVETLIDVMEAVRAA